MISEINIQQNRITYRINGVLSETYKDCLEFNEFETREEIVDSGYGNWERHEAQEVEVALDFEELSFEKQCEILMDNHHEDNELESPTQQDGDSPTQPTYQESKTGIRTGWQKGQHRETRKRVGNRQMATA